MVHSLQFHSGYPTRLEGVRTHRFEFNDRINLVVGPNGSGKSTILAAIASALGIYAGGWSRTPAVSRSRQAYSTREGLPYEATAEWDGRPAFYQDCYGDSETSFIDPAYLEREAMLRSTGEKRVGLINQLIDDIEERFPTFRLRRDDRPTLLLDEVDNHVGFAGQAILWKDIIPRLSKKYQLIISTHSIFPLLLRRDNLLREDRLFELTPQYAYICVDELHAAVRYFNREGDGAGDAEDAGSTQAQDAEQNPE
ncbi:MAG: AAA family ATPase [Spirochaetaceae bacterium]